MLHPDAIYQKWKEQKIKYAGLSIDLKEHGIVRVIDNAGWVFERTKKHGQSHGLARKIDGTNIEFYLYKEGELLVSLNREQNFCHGSDEKMLNDLPDLSVSGLYHNSLEYRANHTEQSGMFGWFN